MSEACHALHATCARLPRHRFDFAPANLAGNGLYVLFEQGEQGHGDDRIVRIGTHRRQGGLVSRLREHFLNANKDRSIFRKNVGRCLLVSRQDPFLSQWELDLTSRLNRQRFGPMLDAEKQLEVEAEVSDYIKNRLSFAVIPVNGREDRLKLEAGLIGTVAQCSECRSSATWTGLHSPKTTIREYGLWQEQHVTSQPLSVAEVLRLTG